MFKINDNCYDETAFEEYKKTIRKAFDRFQASDQSDGLGKTDFKCAWLYLFGYKISKFELQEYFAKLGKNYYTDRVNYRDFEAKALADVKRLDMVEELRNAFMMLDFSCKGFLEIDDLNKHFSLVAPHIQANKIGDIFRELDRDCDGRVSYKDFEIAMQYYNDDGH